MRRLPFPVAIATTAIGKKKRGVTIGSFTSVSMQPPLISFNIDKGSQIHDLIYRATHYAIHLPQPDQSSLCDHFAQPGQSSEEQFGNIDHYRSAYGNPILKGIPTVIQCRAYERFAAGDHTLLLGEVLEIEQDSESPSVLYHNRSYHTIGPETTKLKRIDKSA